jgi:hypothetical protein
MPLREPDGAVSGVLLHGVDVTERTRANALAVGQRGALELAVTDAPLGDVLDVLARTAEDVSGGAALASVQLVSSDGQHLRHAAAPSLPLEFQLALDAMRLGPLAGAATTAAWRGEAVATPTSPPIRCGKAGASWPWRTACAAAARCRSWRRPAPCSAPSACTTATPATWRRRKKPRWRCWRIPPRW